MADQRRNNRSPEAAAYRRLYKSARWQRLRSAQLTRQPLCEMCASDGRVTAATICDHRTPHRGDLALFHDLANLASLCKPCHDTRKQAEERRGFSTEVDEAGWPTDPMHPANREGVGQSRQRTA